MLNPENLQPKRKWVASEQDASNYKKLLMAWFNVSFRMFFDKQSEHIQLRADTSLINDIISLIDEFKSYISTTDSSSTSFINHPKMTLELRNFEEIIHKKWLKDDSISIFLDALNMMENHDQNYSASAKSYCFGSLTFAKLMDSLQSISPFNEKKFAETFAEKIKAGDFTSNVFTLFKDHSNIEKLHFVVNIKQTHFCILSTNTSLKEVISTDPIASTDFLRKNRSLFSKLIGVIYHAATNNENEAIYLGKKDIQETSYSPQVINSSKPSFAHRFKNNIDTSLPTQRDDYNCGVYAMY